jgi:nitrilase
MQRVGSVQMASGANLAANLDQAGQLIGAAAAAGAGLVVLPENFAIMGRSDHDKLALREAPGSGPIQDFLSAQARRHKVWLVGGTVPVDCGHPDRVFARSPLYDASGELVGAYDKIHLFDVDLEDAGERYRESETIAPGEREVVLETPFGRLGLAVCYDLRFPELFRGLVDRGAELVALPAAFTEVTGRAHWECLVRARAIENQVHLIAAGQGGYHVDGRATHGDSMVVDPWGRVLCRLAKGAGAIVADLDRERLARTRRSFPVLGHRRLSCHINGVKQA